AKSHAAAAHHAAIDEQSDRITHLSPPAGERSNIGPPLPLAVLEMIILQVALPRLVANRAIDRMIDEQRLFDLRPSALYRIAIGDKSRAVLGRRLTSRNQLGNHRDRAGLGVPRAAFDQAHPATGHDRQPRMPAVVRNNDAGPQRDLNSIEPLLLADLDL